ncbi:MAG TPA: hypothetical protein ENJ62_04665, partial [Bryobacterales bacterium]|nr:hypothetical protein [Bryobacterales bacterium]
MRRPAVTAGRREAGRPALGGAARLFGGALAARAAALLAGLWLAAAAGWGAEFRAGAARVDVTPEGPIWMSGYAVRDHPSEGVDQPLYVRALALEDAGGRRFVFVSLDLIGIPRSLADEVAARAAKEYGLERAQLLLNASHTHAGPVVWP